MALAIATEYKPAVAYLRRSTDRQEQSIADQRQAIESYATQEGYELLDCYVDDAISGTSSEARKAFLQMIQDAQSSRCPFSYVLCYDVKRFGRSITTRPATSATSCASPPLAGVTAVVKDLPHSSHFESNLYHAGDGWVIVDHQNPLPPAAPY